MSGQVLEFWFEFGSTYSYPAAARIEGLAADSGVGVSWEPFLLGPIFGRQGWNDSPFNIYPAKGRYMWRDMERLCAGYGIPFERPSRFPRDSLLAARIACLSAATGEPWLPDFARAVFRANFAEDREIGGAPVIRSVLGSLGLPGTAAPRAGEDAREQVALARARRAGRRARHLRGAELRRGWRALLGQRPP